MGSAVAAEVEGWRGGGGVPLGSPDKERKPTVPLCATRVCLTLLCLPQGCDHSTCSATPCILYSGLIPLLWPLNKSTWLLDVNFRGLEMWSVVKCSSYIMKAQAVITSNTTKTSKQTTKPSELGTGEMSPWVKADVANSSRCKKRTKSLYIGVP